MPVRTWLETRGEGQPRLECLATLQAYILSLTYANRLKHSLDASPEAEHALQRLALCRAKNA